MPKLSLLLCSLAYACQADERSYRTANTSAAVAQPAGEAVSVYFDNLPDVEDSSVNINVRVTSRSGAVEYQYALLPLGEAGGGNSAICLNADYSDFMPLTQAITQNDLQAGHYQLCAKGKNSEALVQQKATSFAWRINTDAGGNGENDLPPEE